MRVYSKELLAVAALALTNVLEGIRGMPGT